MSSSVPQSDKSNKRSDEYDPAYDPTVSDADLTAEQYLLRQRERAKAAMMGAAGAIKTRAMQKIKAGNPSDGDAGSGGDSGPVKLIKKHPWYSVGAATAAGFAGALYLNPSRFGRLKGRIKKLEQKLAEQEKDGTAAKGASDSKAQTATKSSIMSSLGTLVVTQALDALKPLLTQYVAPMMAGHGQNGHGDEGYPYADPGQPPMSPEVEAALRARYAGEPPPRSAGDPSI